MKHNDLEALKLLKEWSAWLVTIQTAAIGAIGAGAKDFGFELACTVPLIGLQCDLLARALGSGVVLFFGGSIIAALYLLLALPAIAQRLPPPFGEDIYAMRTSAGLRLPLYWYVRVERWGSVAGFFLLALLILLVIWTRGGAGASMTR